MEHAHALALLCFTPDQQAPCTASPAAMERRSCLCRLRLRKLQPMQVYLARLPRTAWRGWLPGILDRLLWHAVLLRELLALAYYWTRGWLC